ncbi:MAG: transglycosylase SLT domain-containing protein [Acidimicrobiia bacterium]
MRLLRTLSVLLLLASILGLVFGGQGSARAQSVEDARQKADQAQQRAEEAHSLLSETANNRAGIEDDLAASLVRLSQLNAELSTVSSELDDLRRNLAQADLELTSLADDLSSQAVDAYVRAVSVPGAVVLGVSDAEEALVASNSIESVMQDDRRSVAELTIKRRALERLRGAYLKDQARVADLQQQADAESDHLQNLLAEADTQVAQAAAQARRADLAYRSALSEVDAARAREAEKRREAERATSTTTVPTTTATSTTTTTSPASSPTTTPGDPPSTTTPPPVTGGTFPPSVERWRPLVSTYFPADRVEAALAVIRCESYGDPNAYNPYSGASGLFQFLPSTWATVSPRAGFTGASPFDPEANIATAAWLTAYYANRGSDPWAAWVCHP